MTIHYFKIDDPIAVTVTPTATPVISIPNDFKLYPNPSKQHSLLDLGKTYENIQVKIETINGQVVYNQQFLQKNQVLLNAEQLDAVMNAAIAQLAGKVADIAAKLNALSIEINSKNGQLQSSEVSGKNDRLDLGDVLAAAKAVATSSSIHGLKAEIKTIVDLQLANANNTQADTQVTPPHQIGRAHV